MIQLFPIILFDRFFFIFFFQISLMQETAKYTRVGPSDRVNKLLAFNKRLRSTEGSMQCFQDWALNLAGDLVNVPARTLPQEVIMLGGNKSYVPEPF